MLEMSSFVDSTTEDKFDISSLMKDVFSFLNDSTISVTLDNSFFIVVLFSSKFWFNDVVKSFNIILSFIISFSRSIKV